MKKFALWLLTICTVLVLCGTVLYAEPEEETPTPAPTEVTTPEPTPEVTPEPSDEPTQEPEETPDDVTPTPKNKVTATPKNTSKPKSTSGSGSGWVKATDIPDDPNRRTNAPPTLPPDEPIEANTPVPGAQQVATEAPVEEHKSVMDSKGSSFALMFVVLILLLLIDLGLIFLREQYLKSRIAGRAEGVVRRRARDAFEDDDDDEDDD